MLFGVSETRILSSEDLTVVRPPSTYFLLVTWFSSVGALVIVTDLNSGVSLITSSKPLPSALFFTPRFLLDTPVATLESPPLTVSLVPKLRCTTCPSLPSNFKPLAVNVWSISTLALFTACCTSPMLAALVVTVPPLCTFLICLLPASIPLLRTFGPPVIVIPSLLTRVFPILTLPVAPKSRFFLSFTVKVSLPLDTTPMLSSVNAFTSVTPPLIVVCAPNFCLKSFLGAAAVLTSPAYTTPLLISSITPCN